MGMAQLRQKRFGFGGGVRRGEDTADASRAGGDVEPRRGEEAGRASMEEEAMESDRGSGGADEVEQGEQRQDEQEWEEAGTYGQRWSEKNGEWIPYHHPARLQMLGVIQELLPAGKASGWTPQDEGGMLAGMTSRTLGLAVEGRTGWNMSDLEDKDMQALFSGCAQEAVRARIDEETHGMRQRKHELSDLEARAEREEAMLQASEREPEEIGVEEPKPEAGGERESG